jgi:hypothetical protein
MKLVDIGDSKSPGFAAVAVRVRPLVPYLDPMFIGLAKKAVFFGIPPFFVLGGGDKYRVYAETF